MKPIDISEQKKISFEILCFLDETCREKKLTYFLAYGTLLGAVRHKGYIPWDDDIDVMMPRKDYDILRKEFPDHPYLKFVDSNTDSNYGKSFGVINDIRTQKKEKLLRNKCRSSVCVNIDIFPLDPMPDDESERTAIFSKIREVERKLACVTYGFGRGRTFLSTIGKNIAITFFRIQELFRATSIANIVKTHTNMMTAYSGINSDTLACLANTGHNGMKEFLPKHCFEKKLLLEFEGKSFWAPAGYDEVLKLIYGDYMKLPPKEKRIQHNSKCYWR